MAHKHCPHCLKVIPLKQRFKPRCPHCHRILRRKSEERKYLGMWLEDRGIVFWFFLILVILVLGAIIGQVNGHSDLLNYIDEHSFWFVISTLYLSMFAATIGRIYLPLLLGAPKILRRERLMIKQFKILTTVGIVAGIVLACAVVGVKDLFYVFPATVFLFSIPIVLVWSYLALVLSDSDYEDNRTWSYLAEIGAADRFEFRYHAFAIMIVLPLMMMLFYYLVKHTGFSWAVMNTVDLILEQVKFATKGKVK